MPVRLAVIDEKLCSPSRCQLECIRNCPVNRMGSDCITLSPIKEEKEKLPHGGRFEYSGEQRKNSVAFIDEQLCTGCGICPKVCPFKAITIVKLVEAKEEERTYSYGENAFHLYRVALPKKGITAIVGENGCGKTTNLKLIAGKLKPDNLPSKEAKEYFAATGEKKVILKPQELAVVREKKTVGELLKSINDVGRLDGLAKAFDLQALYGRKLEQLSGGELQKVAVSAALLRDREIFVLDEPFAFLDYAYRLRLMAYLNENFAEKRVLVVDHDVSLLSYLCQQSYILFGKPAAYGVVSQPYATDRAINMFISGFIAPENVKFRQSISYKHYRQAAGEKTGALLEISPFSVKKGSFVLESPAPIKVMAGEVVGIAGVNGIGKSTFCAKVHEEHDSSLKPQLLERGSGLAGEGFSRGNPYADSFVQQMSMQRLEYLREGDLSGGEHQKLELLKALSNDKKLYLLDEPTNMLDVPSRMTLSKIVRERAQDDRSVMLVDHDFEFLYNTVDRIIVVGGESGVRGEVRGIYSREEGMRELMRGFGLSYRRDPEEGRLKLNKEGSRKDEELKKAGKFVEG